MAITAQDTKLKPGYKQTEVGVIPEEWEAKSIGELITFSGGSQPPRSTFKFQKKDGYIKLIQIRDYKTDEFETYIPEGLAQKKCIANDIMIGRYGPPIFQILRGIEGAYNVALLKAIPSSRVDREYLYHFLKQESLFHYVESLSQRSSGQTGIEMPALKNYPFPLPPLSEQHTIATALSDVDALITSLDTIIAKKFDIMQAAMQQLLTGKTRLPGFAGDGSAKLGDFFELNPNKPYFNDTDLVTLIRMEDVSESGRIINQNIMPLSSIKKGLTYFERNDVLVAKITPCFENGKGACLDILETNSGFGSTEFHILRAKKNAIPRYIFYQTQTVEFRQRLEAEMIGTAGQKRVPARAIIDYSLPVLHSIAEQQAIASILTDIDADIVALEQKRDKTRALKQGMMQELLTGKTRLV